MSLAPLPNIDFLKDLKLFLQDRHYQLDDLSHEFESSVEDLISKTGLFSLIEIQKDYFDENFWFFNKKVPLEQAYHHYSKDSVQQWIQNGIIQQEQNYIQSYFTFIPYEGFLYLGDRIQDNTFSDDEQVMPASFSTMSLFRHLNSTPGPILELGCGSGFLGIHMAKGKSNPLILTDLNPRAVKIATLNSKLNNIGANSNVYNWKDALTQFTEFENVIFNTPSMPVYKTNSLLVNFYGNRINQITQETLEVIDRFKNIDFYLWTILCLTEEVNTPEKFIEHHLPLNHNTFSFYKDTASPFSLSPKHILKRKIPLGNWLLQNKEDKELFFSYLANNQITEIISGVIKLQT